MKRSFDVGELEMRSDGRTVEGRIVPYNQVETIVERDRTTGELVKFKEQFKPGSCLAMAQSVAKRGNAAFISFLMEHDEHNFDSKIGYATNLEDRSDGAYATFRLYEGKDLDKVRSMLRESHKGLSVNFGDTRPPKVDDDGTVSRVQVHIDHVAATPTPCYAGAGIVAMRHASIDVNSSDLTIVQHETPNLDSVKEWLASMKGANA